MTSIRVAIVGVGNCASSLVQGVQYYRDAEVDTKVPGLMQLFPDDHEDEEPGSGTRESPTATQ